MPFFRVSFSPIFSRTGYISKERQFFWSPLSKHVKRGNFVRTFGSFEIFVFWSILFANFFLESGTIWRQKFWSQVRTFFCGHLYKFRSSALGASSVYMSLNIYIHSMTLAFTICSLAKWTLWSKSLGLQPPASNRPEVVSRLESLYFVCKSWVYIFGLFTDEVKIYYEMFVNFSFF